MRYLSRSVLIVYGSAFAGTLLVAVEVPSSVTSLGAVERACYTAVLYCGCCCNNFDVVEPDLTCHYIGISLVTLTCVLSLRSRMPLL